MLWTREEVFYAHRGRHPMHLHYRSGATKDGKLVGTDAKIVIDGGARTQRDFAFPADRDPGRRW